MNGKVAGNPVRHSPTCSCPELHTTAARAIPTLAHVYLGEMRAEELCSELVGFLSIFDPVRALLAPLLRRTSILFTHHLSHPKYYILSNVVQAGYEPKAAASPGPLPWSEAVQGSFLSSPASSKIALLFCLFLASHKLHH